jgi:hypothetical protein
MDEEVTPNENLAETDNYLAWMSEDDDGERIYHIELGGVTLHFDSEEWDELVELMEEAAENT